MANIVPRRSSLLGSLSTDRAAGKNLAAIQSGAFLERTEDEARCNLTMGRMTDFGRATRHAMDEGCDIIDDLARRVESNPLNQAVQGIAEDGINGLRHELRRLRGF